MKAMSSKWQMEKEHNHVLITYIHSNEKQFIDFDVYFDNFCGILVFDFFLIFCI